MTSQIDQPETPRVRTPLPSASVVLILVLGSAFWIISRGIGATPHEYLGLVPETSFVVSNWYRFLSYGQLPQVVDEMYDDNKLGAVLDCIEELEKLQHENQT